MDGANAPYQAAFPQSHGVRRQSFSDRRRLKLRESLWLESLAYATMILYTLLEASII